MADFTETEITLNFAKAIAWDTCHKIYLLMDDEQVEKMREYGYGDEPDPDSLITNDQMSYAELLATVKRWYDQSCGLRFIQAVQTVAEGVDPNEGFISLIDQFENDEDECEDCDQRGCAGACNDFVVDDEDDDEDDDDE